MPVYLAKPGLQSDPQNLSSKSQEPTIRPLEEWNSLSQEARFINLPMRFLFLTLGATSLALSQELLEPVVVIGERTREILPNETAWYDFEIQEFAPQTIDALLATDPSFSLYRRQSALFGNPTSSGVSLRNIGATAASRSLVLLDGIPQNDPFGGWVNWARYDPALLSRVRLSSSSQSSTWGNLSVGGSIQLTSKAIKNGQGGLTLSGGSHGYLAGSFFQDLVSDDERWRFRVGAHASQSEGYFLLQESQRGEIDRRADLETRGAFLQAEWSLNDDLEIQSRLSWFHEERGNGTALTGNSTEAFDYSLRVLGEHQDLTWQALLFYQDRQFTSVFSAAAPDRSSERLALDQFEVPGTGLGGGLTLDWEASDRLQILGGFDFRLLSGETNENAGTFRRRRAGGEQDVFGAFATVKYEASPTSRIDASLRLDHWELRDGLRRETSLSTGNLLRDDSSRDRDDWEPTFSLRWEQDLADEWLFDLAVGSSYRLPTLNELHRPFRVRGDITEANPSLQPERYHFLESGLAYRLGDPFSFRFGGFHYWIDDAIANLPVTDPDEISTIFGSLPVGGSGSQRRNVDRSRVYGAEGHFDWAIDDSVTFSGKGLWSNTRFESSPGQALLENESFPQSPAFAMNLAAHYHPGQDWRFSLEVDYQSSAYDDLLGERKLPEFCSSRLSASWQATDDLRLGARVENLFDAEIISGSSNNGLVALGQPRAFWLSADWQF
ncbi:MAG: outer membrane receptor protein involved in Fe transport [Akkermansiaceae bacterium]|jgi:outer membrane receptor protein involved in Fe transport